MKYVAINCEDFLVLYVCNQKTKKERIKSSLKKIEEALKYQKDGSFEISIKRINKSNPNYDMYEELAKTFCPSFRTPRLIL